MKFVVCGPPHSGKSVFVDSLLELLPTNIRYCFRGTYDGEGRWSNISGSKEIDEARKKNKASYDEMNIIRWSEMIKGNGTPILLVDIGGKCWPDKAPFFDACDKYIIVCKEDELSEIDKWKEMASIYGRECLLIAETSLDVEEDTELDSKDGTWRVKLHGLHRGAQLKSNVMHKIAVELLKCVSDAKEMQGKGFVYFSEIAKEMGCDNGWFMPEMGPILYDKIKALANETVTCMFGTCPLWLAAISACCFRDNNCIDSAFFFDQRTFSIVLARQLHVSQDYQSMDNPVVAELVETDNYVRLSLSIGKDMPTENLYKCVLPEINTSKTLLIDGALPTWFIASLTISYKSKEKYFHMPKLCGYVCGDSADKKCLGKFINSNNLN